MNDQTVTNDAIQRIETRLVNIEKSAARVGKCGIVRSPTITIGFGIVLGTIIASIIIGAVVLVLLVLTGALLN